ncbi:hypothetical protein DFH08DRAFT_923452 [Mycena albidolilacea]|uniref:Uncharacterized protein n=1 Tax=Mycena albidolilacea TaxID=1033008 RepID=A0AAD7EW93_9AGAR|nr:hypothetical protein DFH08DRAFT_923452 [Mycena albidolilacea]
MAYLLAPYNSAMRLGMGFNSFTQQLCINDAVKTTDNQTATEKNLRPQYKKGDMDSSTSQVVTWSAKFVDRISEVTDSLNISGSLEIKCDAIGGGGGASAHFIDSNKFKESDLNYFIQVKVTNEQLVAHDVTEFCPIANVSDADFTRVYGDSFISGFIEGGEFNALVSIKLKDRSKAKEIGGQLKVELDLKAASVKGTAKGDKKDLESSYEGETTISVSWTGGGDIKDESVTDWTFATLKAVAMEFPEHVMACPMRTNAILTKYTSLKSFHEKTLKGSPLDYENAGVYSSALLDAYMDFKVMWRNIQMAAWEVEQGQSYLIAKLNLPEFSEMAAEAKKYYAAQTVRYQKSLLGPAVESGTSSLIENGGPEGDGSTVMQVVKAGLHEPVEAPLPPNALTPYPATIFGLDKARRDCRFEMIKIVKEVDAVAHDPKVAIDPSRIWQYLSPAVFRLLLPSVHNVDAEKRAAAASEEARLAEENLAKTHEAVQDALTEVRQKLADTEVNLVKAQDQLGQKTRAAADLEKRLASVESTVKELVPYGGYCPVPLDSPVRFLAVQAGTAVDYDAKNPGIKVTHMWQSYLGPNQGWRIIHSKYGFYIKHIEQNKYLQCQTVSANNDRIYIGTGDVGSTFLFEQMPDGTTMVHLADRLEYTLNVEGGSPANTTKLIMWLGGKGNNDRWRIRDYSQV